MGLLVVMSMTSCTNVGQSVMDAGAVYSGVSLIDPSVAYCVNGKNYVKGERADFRRIYTGAPLEFYPGSDRFRKIDGTESDILYREISIKEDSVSYTSGSQWVSLESEPVRVRKLPHLFQHTVNIDGDRELTWRALYTYPLGAVTTLCVDVPLGAAVASVAGVCFLPPFLLSAFGVFPQQQQVEIPTPPQDANPSEQN